jgi:hypothetical protein
MKGCFQRQPILILLARAIQACIHWELGDFLALKEAQNTCIPLLSAMNQRVNIAYHL